MRTSRRTVKRGGLAAAALLFVSVAATGGLAAAATTSSDQAVSADTEAGSGLGSPYSAAADYTADSWASFLSARKTAAALTAQGSYDTAARAKLQSAVDGLVMVRGLKSLVADYRTRSADRYTSASWKPFATALSTANSVAANPAATAADVAAAKTALMTAADSLTAADEGTFQTLTNDTFWNDTNGNPIYSQGGGVFKFGDTYYWYGVHYSGAEQYRANPTTTYGPGFVAIPVYSSRDLVHWKFERNVATTSTTLPGGGRLGGWVGRLGVVYNENTGKYVLITQGPGGVVFLRGDSPTDTFDGAAVQGQITNVSSSGTGDQTVFVDDDGKDYLVFSNAHGRNNAYVAKLRDSDSLYVEPAVRVGSNSAGREGNAMFKLDGRYYIGTSDLHGWNTSVTHVIESGSIQSGYSDEYTLAGTEMDYSHVTQTGFFVTVNGTKKHTVIYAGDRWADFAWNGLGYNQWVPVDKTGSRPQFHSLSQWQFNATTGEWREGPQNNYILNPEFAADRVTVSTLTGWTNTGGSVSNTSGANGTRFALQLGGSAGVRQQITVPAGTYRLSAFARTSGSVSSGQVTVTDAGGAVRTLDLPGSNGWTPRELAGVQLAAGAATVTIRAGSGSGNLYVDGLSLAPTSTAPPTTPPTTAPPTTPPTTPATTPPTMPPTTPPPTATTPPATTPPPSGSVSCSVAYSISGQWQGGFQGAVTIRNTGTNTVNGWSLAWTFANGQRISQGWNGTFAQTGSKVTVTNASHNADIAPGGAVSLGFIGTLAGTTNSTPASFTLNGAPCSRA